ncbi:hypothetical protein D3C78_1834860 [compost metagenome]
MFLFWKTMQLVPVVTFLTRSFIGFFLPPRRGRTVSVVRLMMVFPLTFDNN